MPIGSTAEEGLRLRLEETVKGLPGAGTDLAGHDLYDRYEMIAIQILDSEHMEHPPGALQEFLESFLHAKQLELGLHPYGDTP
jgi:hypothetical protein